LGGAEVGMAKHPDYPGVSPMTDRHGKVRWRFRRNGHKDIMLAGEPHSPEFDSAYEAAIEGRAQRNAEIIRMPGAASPRSFDATWQRLKATRKWKSLDPKSQVNYSRVIEKFLMEPLGDGRIGTGPISDFKRRHVNVMLDRYQDTPGMARLLLICLRKLVDIALDLEWIEVDPTQRITYNPVSDGHKAWPPHICARFENHWPVGSKARTAYALGRWLGIRVSDVVRLRWDQRITKIIDGAAVGGFEMLQYKGRNRKNATPIFIPRSPMLDEALALLPIGSGTILAKDNGEPYRAESISDLMVKWTEAAGIERGYTMHGLRKSLGGMLADADATTHQSRDVLGHRTMAEVERYARSREQARLATTGMAKVIKFVRG
jgi:integrase